MRSFSLMLICGSILAMSTGCSGNSSGASSSVSGHVTLADVPVAQGSVMFIAADGKSASAPIEPDGKYQLKCFPQKYQVAVVPPPPRDPRAPATSATDANRPAIPKKYQDVGTSQLAFEVVAGTNQFDIKMEKGK